MFSAEELLTVQPLLDVKHWLSFCTYGTETPTKNASLELRVSSIEYAKKAISSYMPNHGEWNTQGKNYGNPTRSKCILKFISESKKKQVRKQGKALCAKRDMKLEEFKMAMKLLQEETTNGYRWSTVLKMQHALIARGDDIHLAQSFFSGMVLSLTQVERTHNPVEPCMKMTAQKDGVVLPPSSGIFSLPLRPCRDRAVKFP